MRKPDSIVTPNKGMFFSDETYLHVPKMTKEKALEAIKSLPMLTAGGVRKIAEAICQEWPIEVLVLVKAALEAQEEE